jgi:perosamine synthetase
MSTRFEPGAPAGEGIIPLCVPEISGKEWDYIKECLETGWVSSVGRFVDRFEKEMAAKVGVQYAVATVNGTAALHIALLVAGVQPQDEVLVSTLSFIAPANAVRYAGAFPIFVDAESVYWQMDPDKVAQFVDRRCLWSKNQLVNKSTGRRVKAILPVHILGHPVDMDPLVELARKYNLAIIEDATESLGAAYKGRMTGCLGDIGCFSFNGNKIITSGGGGMIATDNKEWADRARYLTTQAKDDPIEYVHKEIGYNYRLTNIQAAMGCAQLEQLSERVEAKRHIAARYAKALSGIPGIICMEEAPWAFSTYWMFTIIIDPFLFGADSRMVLRRLEGKRIQARPLWQPIHLSPAHAFAWGGDFSVAEHLHANALSLPCSTNLSYIEQDLVIANLRNLRGWSP